MLLGLGVQRMFATDCYLLDDVFFDDDGAVCEAVVISSFPFVWVRDWSVSDRCDCASLGLGLIRVGTPDGVRSWTSASGLPVVIQMAHTAANQRSSFW